MARSRTRRGLLLAEGPFSISHRQIAARYKCLITFDLKDQGTIRIECLDPMPLEFYNTAHEEFLVEVPFAVEPMRCLAKRSKLQLMGRRPGLYLSLFPRFGNFVIDEGRLLRRVNAGIVNLGEYLMPRLAKHFDLECEAWKFRLTCVADDTMSFSPNIQDDSYVFTHHLVLERVDESLFSAADADLQLQLLSHFFSFCHEHWVSPALVCGLDDSGVLSMQEWGTRLLSKDHWPQNWLDLHHGNAMVDLFPGFMRRMKDEAWRDIVRKVLYWYVRADTGYVGSDGAIILLQAALEMLSWFVLVRHRRALSKDGFAKISAADHIRLLLNVASIPAEIPANLERLRSAAAALNWGDGPHALVSLRNRLVHPKKVNASVGHPFYDAFTLGKWYLELVLLRSFGYTGTYSNRTRKARHVGAVEPVPWAAANPLPDL